MKVVINQKSLERIVSQKALKMGNSFQWKIFVMTLLASLLLMAALTSLGFIEVSGFSFSLISSFYSSSSSNSQINGILLKSDTKPTHKASNSDDPESLLYSAWTSLLSEPNKNLEKLGFNESTIPKGPHLENCESRTKSSERLDKRDGNSSFPPWTGWRGELEKFADVAPDERFDRFRHQAASLGSYPPWVIGADEENYPMTRKVQRDLWLSQHPLNCSDPSVRFLVADWEREPGFGIGAQIAGMSGLFAIAVNEKRVLVTGFYNRADHDGCNGPFRSSWSCYFFPETSQECRERAFELVRSEEAWKNGIIKGKQSYSSKEIWTVPSPRIWGDPWSFLLPTTEINGSLIAYHRKMDRRWWRAQAVRYLMRFQSKYTCKLMNIARHEAFGKEAASMVVKSLPVNWPKNVTVGQRSNIEDFVWSNHKAWVPRPLLSVHVRMGDKACEMKVVGFEEYMKIAGRVRRRFPNLSTIWLSTEMQEVIDKSKGYKEWKFYYTKVRRQVGSVTMANYEASLGRETSTNYPIVNFLMATEADYFVGALGSTWCFLIDGMRNTGGKVMAGYLSVNKDRFW